MEVAMIRNYKMLDFPGLKHGITTRVGGVSKGDYVSMNTGIFGSDVREDVLKNISIAADRVGITASSIFMTHQTHSDRIFVIDESTELTSLDVYDQAKISERAYQLYAIEDHDAMVTNRTDIALMTFHADCVPIIVYDPIQHVVAAIHSGWLGTSKMILSKTLDLMHMRFGSLMSEVKVVIGQSASVCCYEVQRNVYEAFEAILVPEEMQVIFHAKADNLWHLDLKEANRLLAKKSGVLQGNIEIDSGCTVCAPSLFHSHRGAKGGNRGMMSILVQLENKTL